jgi:type IV pilus assembly protein PilN
VQASIDDIKQQMANHEAIKAQLKALKDREEAITKLQSARSGPTATLLELSRILTPGKGPTVDRTKLEQLRRDNPQAAPNPSWEARRVWLAKVSEAQRSMRITGFARDAEDVSEFLRRLQVSDFFSDVRLMPAMRTTDPATQISIVSFEMTAKVKY